jgi:hypothetical protein
MAYSYDEHQGSPQDISQNVKMAGVIDISEQLSNIQQSNSISRTLPGNKPSGVKAPVVPIKPKGT